MVRTSAAGAAHVEAAAGLAFSFLALARTFARAFSRAFARAVALAFALATEALAFALASALAEVGFLART